MNLTSFSLAASIALAQPTPTFDADSAARIFERFETLCEADEGALWGVSLCGPMMLVDRDSRIAFFNAEPPVASERLGEDLYRGRYPDGLTLANTSTTWEGQRWLQLIEKPGDTTELDTLLVHEAYHGIQDRLGFSGGEGFNDHLEEEQARYWLRLEAAALAEALTHDANWRDKLADAMRFNRQRAMLYPESRANEAALVNHEGLAEYTGIKIAAGQTAPAMAAQRLEGAKSRPSLVRTLGYVIGPAYGLMLDRLGADWKALALAGTPMPLLIEGALDGRSAETAAADIAARAQIAAEEQVRGERRRAMLADLRARFVEGPVLTLPIRKMNVSFDPNKVTTLDDLGTVRSQATVGDLWGTLSVEGDVLMSKNWSYAAVPLAGAPDGSHAEGDGWTVDLADGWAFVPGEREGDWTLKGPE